MVPIVRSFISIPAGIERMTLITFLALTASGSLIWNSAFVMAGYFLGVIWHLVEEYVGIYSKGVLVLTIAAALFIVTRPNARRQRA